MELWKISVSMRGSQAGAMEQSEEGRERKGATEMGGREWGSRQSNWGKSRKGKMEREGERKEGEVGYERRVRRPELLRTDLNMALMQSCQDLFHWNVKLKLPFIFKFQDPPAWAWLIVQLVERLPYMQEILGSIHNTHKPGTMVYTSIVPTLQRWSQ